MATNNADEDKTCLEEVLGKMTDSHFPFCQEVGKYENLRKIGQGTYGEVFKAQHRETGKVVALKRVLIVNEKKGFPMTSLREIKILKLLKHENVVNLIEVCRSKEIPSNCCTSTIYLVFDFCEHDLRDLIMNVDVKFTLGEIKMMMKQILNGLYFIHTCKILHRDIKPANILITKNGTLKIADFGFARAFSEVRSADRPNRYTNKVATLWYRPPELLLGERNYGYAIDMWGVGCIMAEMWTRTPILKGDTEQQQLILISTLCGSITQESFPGCEKLDLWSQVVLPEKKRKVKKLLKPYVKDKHALSLLSKFLTIDPARRIDSDKALNHDFFWADPLPCELTKMLQPHTQSMLEYLYSSEKDNVKQPGAGPSNAHPTANDGQPNDTVF